MLHKKIDSRTRIVLGSDSMRILQCKPGDEIDISMMFENNLKCHALIIRKVQKAEKVKIAHSSSSNNRNKKNICIAKKKKNK